MPSLSAAVVSGSLAALRLVRKFLSLPAIIYTPTTVLGVPLTSQTVFLELVQGSKERLVNQVSKQLLVDVSKGKNFINDNIAPMPRQWNLVGYLFPLVPLIPDTDQIQLESLKETLRQASDSRQPVQFRPPVASILSQFSQAFDAAANGKITGTLTVVIESIDFDWDPTILNKVPFTMTISMMNSLSAQTITGSSLNSASPDGDLTNPAASPASNPLGNTANINVPVVLP